MQTKKLQIKAKVLKPKKGTLDGLIGIGKNTFKTSDGWEKFIKNERSSWR